MNENKNDYCNHKWDSDAPVRLCFRCGQVRMFPNGDLNPRLLWPGRETKDDPLQIPKADKILIAGVAKRGGILKVVKATGISMVILRAWVGAYCRKPHEPRGVHSVGALPTPQPEVRKRGRPKKRLPITEPPAKLPLPPPLTLRPPLAVILTKFDPGNCLMCGGPLIIDNDEKPHYIQTPSGKLWLCGVCAERAAKLFEALEITCQVIVGKDQ